MRNVLGHRSWSEQELLSFFDKGTFTMCKLPHYRYRKIQLVCGKLKACGLIEKVGSDETGVNYVAKPEYHQWRKDVLEGKVTPSLDKLFKIMNPPRLLKRSCRQCRAEFQTFQHAQKFCSKECKGLVKTYNFTGKFTKSTTSNEGVIQ